MSNCVVELPTQTIRDDLRWCLALSRAPAVRPIGQWVEEEIILPEGPHKGERYRHSRHPASRLWFAELDSHRWNRTAATGPTQNGKTLMCYVLPVLHHLFELKETVIVGLPTIEMANDKYSRDLLPTIEASRYRDLLPTSGEGSRGGMVKREIKFKNGASLRFMSGGGRDQKRAGYTSRVLAVTEVDGLDEAGRSSREADKIEQLEGRTRAYGRRGKQVYLECTVSVESGRIWQEWTSGTQSKLVRPCPHCGAWVSPEREHLVGWRDAVDEEEASEKSHFICPDCGHPWSESERWESAAKAKLVHRGQEVTPDGDIVGEAPRTKTLGFRWSAIDNPFTTAADLGAEEWIATARTLKRKCGSRFGVCRPNRQTST
jgi:phage terminase large subunit GpA-like protein